MFIMEDRIHHIALKFRSDAIHKDTGSASNDLETNLVGIIKCLGGLDIWLQPDLLDSILVGFLKDGFGD